MSRLAALATLIAVTGLSAQDVTKEMEKLNGVWVATSADSGGVKVPADDVKDFKLTIKGGEYTASLGKEEQKGTLKIDPTKKPMTMDITLDTGPNKGKTQLAIYELQAGVLKVCVSDIDKKERPTNFDTKDKPGVTLLVFKKGM